MEQLDSSQTINLNRQCVGQKRIRVIHFFTHEQELNPKMDCLTSIKRMDEEEDVMLTEVGQVITQLVHVKESGITATPTRDN